MSKPHDLKSKTPGKAKTFILKEAKLSQTAHPRINSIHDNSLRLVQDFPASPFKHGPL